MAANARAVYHFLLPWALIDGTKGELVKPNHREYRSTKETKITVPLTNARQNLVSEISITRPPV